MPLPLNQNYGAWKTSQDTVKDQSWENKKGKVERAKTKERVPAWRRGAWLVV